MKPKKPDTDNKVLIPLFEVKVPAGFPSPADNYQSYRKAPRFIPGELQI